MVTQETTLILGAGASTAYGYPVGKELIKRIISIGVSESDIMSINTILYPDNPRHKLGELANAITNFKNRLQNSGAASIDSFLEVNKKDNVLLLVGKALLLKSLFEKQEILIPKDDHWYELIWKDINSDNSIDSILKNKLNIISFNYEMSLERYLERCFTHYYLDGEKRLQDFRNWMNIKHVYGKVELYKNSSEDIQISLEDINNIKLYHDVINDETRDEIRDTINQSTDIYFLGFSYLKQNMKLLGVNWSNRGELKGSCFEFTNKEIKNVISNYFPNKGNMQPPLRLGYVGWKTEKFYREEVLLK